MADLNSLEDLGKAIKDADKTDNVEGADATIVADANPEQADAPVYVQKLDEHGRAYATGNVKTPLRAFGLNRVRAKSSSTNVSSQFILRALFCRWF